MHPTTEEIADDDFTIPPEVVRALDKVDASPQLGSSRIQTRSAKGTPASSTTETKENKREDLTALKALDVLLRNYDRRSTPTNDLGECLDILHCISTPFF